MNTIEVWEPRYHDRKVLLAKYKVGMTNRIVIQKGAYKGNYKMSGETIKKYPLMSNGKVDCFAVPVNELERLDEN